MDVQTGYRNQKINCNMILGRASELQSVRVCVCVTASSADLKDPSHIRFVRAPGRWTSRISETHLPHDRRRTPLYCVPPRPDMTAGSTTIIKLW
jgi:hypothetical protein